MLHECALLVPYVPAVSVKFLIKYNCRGLGVGLGVVCYAHRFPHPLIRG